MKILFLLLALFMTAAAEAAAPPVAGAPAPDFTLPDAGGKTRHLADWRGRWVVLYFYPKDDTPGCTTEAKNFRDTLARFHALKAEIVGVSLDTGASHQAFADKHQLPFPLLADVGGAVARNYGALSDYGVIKFAKRYTFLIDPEGRVAKAYLQVEAGGHAAEILADLKTLAAN